MSNLLEFTNRFEAKYTITPVQAEKLREVLPYYLESDPHGGDNGGGYWNTSLYLDDHGFSTYLSSVCGEKNRFKWRLRWYGRALGAPVILEEKRRTTDTIAKSRIRLQERVIGDLLEGKPLSEDYLEQGSPSDWSLAAEKVRRAMRLALEPKCLTIDSQLRSHGLEKRAPGFDSSGWKETQQRLPILELKYQSTIPAWMIDLVSEFGLQRRSIPKYLLCVDAAYERTAIPQPW